MSPFGPLDPLRHRPIGDLSQARQARRDFRQRIPIVRDNRWFGESVIEAREAGLRGENFYSSAKNPPYWQAIAGATDKLWLRRTVADKLALVNARAAAAGLELYLFDAWRPRAVQVFFHDIWMPRELQRRGTPLTGTALTEEVERYWAAPSDGAESPAPHATGAAMDLTLRWRDGEQLWMGSLFDDVTALAHRDRFEDWLMLEEGFAGHPDEWWHFSWGDQLWAALSGAPAAHYGLAVVAEEG
jgi:D-alanyl-D-alanine dipeptidase